MILRIYGKGRGRRTGHLTSVGFRKFVSGMTLWQVRVHGDHKDLETSLTQTTAKERVRRKHTRTKGRRKRRKKRRNGAEIEGIKKLGEKDSKLLFLKVVHP